MCESLSFGALKTYFPPDTQAQTIWGDNLLFSMSLAIQNFYLTQGVSFVQSRNVEGPEGLGRKQACLALLLHFLDTYQGLLQEEEGAGHIIKVGLGGKRWVSWLSALPGAPVKDSRSSSWVPGIKEIPWGFCSMGFLSA